MYNEGRFVGFGDGLEVGCERKKEFEVDFRCLG